MSDPTAAATFRSFYDSAWQHPGAAWAAGLVLIGAVSIAWRPRLFGLLVALEAAILVDAWMTGALSPIPAGSPWALPVAIGFVLLGDGRFFYLLERQRRDRPRALAAALAWTLVVPVTTSAARLLLPAVLTDARRTFLLYEVLFAVLAVAMIAYVRSRFPASPVRVWLVRLATFELVQYALWAAADVVVLRDLDAGFALRVVPNVLYYAVFVPFAVAAAPAEARA